MVPASDDINTGVEHFFAGLLCHTKPVGSVFAISDYKIEVKPITQNGYVRINCLTT
jgi:hypothetical protein